MIKKLQKKFIVVAIISVTLVLSTFIIIMNVINYRSVQVKADDTLRMLETYNGEFPNNPPHSKPKDINPETPYEIRYFSVRLDVNGKIVNINIDRIAAIDADEAGSYANKLYAKGSKKGYLENYRYLKSDQENYVLYIFLDCSRELNIFNDYLVASIILSLSGLMIFFILIIIFSGIIVKPVAESYKKQKQFITDASHELKTPLTIIGANADILEMVTGGNEQTQTIKNQVAMLSEFTNRLVYLSRMDEENTKILMTDFSLSEVIEDIIKNYKPIIESQSKELNYDIASNLTLNGDMSSIVKMVSLLLDNAIKYSNEGGQIYISLSQVGKNKKIVVSNTTTGVKIGNLNILFERFYRLDSSRNSKTGGHGIGLSVVKAIVDLHKGKINAISNDGISIIFTIIF